MKSIAPLERGNIPIMAAVLAAVLAGLLATGPTIPAARAGQPDLVGALRARGAQIVPLGVRGGLSGYLVTPPNGAGYSLYVTGDGHGVAGLLYRPDGVLLTGRQLAAAQPVAARLATGRDRNRPAGTAPNPPGTRAPGTASVAPAGSERRPEEPPEGRRASAVAPPAGESRAQAGGAEARESSGPAATPQSASLPKRSPGQPGSSVRRPLSASRSAGGGRWSSCSAMRAARGRARRSPGSAARRWPAGCGCMSCRWRCSARLRRSERRGSPPVPIRRTPGSRARTVRRGVRRPGRPGRPAGTASRATTPPSSPGARAPCR